VGEIDLDRGRIGKVVIAGGGTAGWIAACALSHQLRGIVDISLVESEQIGTIGVGESTIPPIRAFHRLMQIDEKEVMRATAATFKLSISFEGWLRKNDRYFHGFGNTGKGTWACDFHHFWLDSLRRGFKSEISDFCLETVASRNERFATLERSEINYAYHMDAGKYARYLRGISEDRGVRRIEGKIREVRQHSESGFVEALVLESGQVVEGDLFIDCTGFRGMLIEQTLHAGYEDWNQWLPCDRAVAMQTESVGPPVPYTRAIAHEAGWRWRIPLQHRVGNGMVYASDHLSDDEVCARLLRDIEGQPINDPAIIRFRTGRRRQAWSRNVVALGLSSGFVEPLESTSIHVIITGVVRLIQMFPVNGISRSFTDKYNEDTRIELERIRDFIILHYCVTERDEPMWRQCREMRLPESLAHRIQLFRERAHAWQDPNELFRVDSWMQVMLGQGIVPEHHHPLAQALSDQDMRTLFDSIRQPIERAVAQMPAQQAFIDGYCKAGPEVWASKPSAMEG